MNLGKLVAGLAIAATLAGCANTRQATTRHEIDANVQSTLTTFAEKVSGADSLIAKADGILVFPEVVKGGMGIGAGYGEGALLIDGTTAAYYNTISGSIGFQLGIQERSEVILFMDPNALEKFRQSKGWEAGIDGSVALVTLGAGGSVDTNSMQQPIIGFVFSNKGLMYNLSFEGAKISRIEK